MAGATRSRRALQKIVRSPLVDYQRLTKPPPFGRSLSADHFRPGFGPISSANPCTPSASRRTDLPLDKLLYIERQIFFANLEEPLFALRTVVAAPLNSRKKFVSLYIGVCQ